MFVSTIKGFGQHAGVEFQGLLMIYVVGVHDLHFMVQGLSCGFNLGVCVCMDVFNIEGNPSQVRRQRCRCRCEYLELCSAFGVMIY